MSTTQLDSQDSIFCGNGAKCFFSLLVVSLLAIFCTYAWLVTYSSWNFFGNEFLGAAFDSLGKHLLHGDVSVAPHVGLWEAFAVNGKTVLYFGPFPALLRILANIVSPSNYGQWSRLSLFLASFLSVFSVAAIFVGALNRNKFLSISQKRFLFVLSLLGFGFGTTLFFLMSCAFIYHEANIWGLAFALCALHFILLFIWDEGRRYQSLLCLGVAAGFCLLSRVTFSFPLFVVLAFFTLFLLWQPQSKSIEGEAAAIAPFSKINWSCSLKQRNLFSLKSMARLFMVLLFPCLTLVFQAWYNYERFGSVAKFADFSHYRAALDSRGSTIKKIQGVVNIKRIPWALREYFQITGKYFGGQAPYMRLQEADVAASGLYPSGFDRGPKMKVISLLIVSPWLLFGASLGFYLLLKNYLRRRHFCLYAVVFLAFIYQVVFILSYYWITTRYTSEFMPLFVFLFALFLKDFGCDGVSKQRVLNFSVIASVLSFLVLFSTISTSLSTLEYITEYKAGVPEYYNSLLKDFFRSW